MEDDSTNIDKPTLTGTAAGISQSAKLYSENVLFQNPRGHGFAAERANHAADIMKGKNAKLVGADNAKHGADRWVDGIIIQSKYCATGSRCIAQCFEDDQMKYLNPDGSPMIIEV